LRRRSLTPVRTGEPAGFDRGAKRQSMPIFIARQPEAQRDPTSRGGARDRECRTQPIRRTARQAQTD
jgi:hypothetical protein